jgi:hypothetical protein
MTRDGQLLPEQPRIRRLESSSAQSHDSTDALITRDHDSIRQWASDRNAEPATGEATRSGPATVNVQDGGAGIRFNFPAAALFRPIGWEEWFDNFDSNGCAFVFDDDSSSNRYRIVKADDWNDKVR